MQKELQRPGGGVCVLSNGSFDLLILKRHFIHAAYFHTTVLKVLVGVVIFVGFRREPFYNVRLRLYVRAAQIRTLGSDRC